MKHITKKVLGLSLLITGIIFLSVALLAFRANWQSVGENFDRNYPALVQYAPEVADICRLTPAEALRDAILSACVTAIFCFGVFWYGFGLFAIFQNATRKRSVLWLIVGIILTIIPIGCVFLYAGFCTDWANGHFKWTF